MTALGVSEPHAYGALLLLISDSGPMRDIHPFRGVEVCSDNVIQSWQHASEMVGVPVRVHDLTGADLGIVHLPLPVMPGDVIFLEHAALRITDVVPTGPDSPLHALVRAKPVRLAPLVSRG